MRVSAPLVCAVLRSDADRIGDVAALTDGYSAAFLGATRIAVAGALLAAALPPGPEAGRGADRHRDGDDLAGAVAA